jgi:hypothetical protein
MLNMNVANIYIELEIIDNKVEKIIIFKKKLDWWLFRS